MGTELPPHQRAKEPKNIFPQLSIRKEGVRKRGGGGGGGWCGLLNVPTCKFLVASVVQARRAVFATS